MNNVTNGTLAQEKQLFFESGIYNNGLEVLKDFLNAYSNCKVCFTSISEHYLTFKAFVQNYNNKSIFILSDDMATNNNFVEVQNVCGDCDLLVCLDYQSVNFCKKLYSKLKINCFYFFLDMPPIEAFLPYYYEFKGKEYKFVQSSKIKNYIINYSEPKQINKQSLVASVCSVVSAYCVFLELYINSFLFGYKLNQDYSQKFELYTQKISNLLSKIRIMPNDFLDSLYVLVLDFVEFLQEQDVTKQKGVCFAHIYKYLSKHNTSEQEICLFGCQIFIHLYCDFFKKYKNYSFYGVNMQKKQQMFSKYLQGEYIASEQYLEKEKIDYLLTRYSEKLQQKTQAFCTIVDKFVDKLLDLYSDCGYSLYKRLDKNKILLALYFVPDYCQEKSLLNIISSYGILDNIV